MKNFLNRVSPIVVTYRSDSLIEEISNIVSLFPNFVIVDNSESKHNQLLKKLSLRFPNGRYVENKQNVGYGAANNQGISLIKSEFALVVNPDVEIDAAAIVEMIKCADKYANAVIIGCQVQDTNYDTPFHSYAWGYNECTPSKYIEPIGDVSTLWLSGCCLLIRTQPFLALGGFDPNLFMYYEEFDICKRANTHGMECILAAHAHIKHRSSTSSSPSFKVSYIKHLHWARSKRIFLNKHGIQITSASECFIKFLANLVMALISLLTLNPKRFLKFAARAHSYLL